MEPEKRLSVSWGDRDGETVGDEARILRGIMRISRTCPSVARMRLAGGRWRSHSPGSSPKGHSKGAPNPPEGACADRPSGGRAERAGCYCACGKMWRAGPE